MDAKDPSAASRAKAWEWLASWKLDFVGAGPIADSLATLLDTLIAQARAEAEAATWETAIATARASYRYGGDVREALCERARAAREGT